MKIDENSTVRVRLIMKRFCSRPEVNGQQILSGTAWPLCASHGQEAISMGPKTRQRLLPATWVEGRHLVLIHKRPLRALFERNPNETPDLRFRSRISLLCFAGGKRFRHQP